MELGGGRSILLSYRNLYTAASSDAVVKDTMNCKKLQS